jgi:undecaprenyl-diphosphatase
MSLSRRFIIGLIAFFALEAILVTFIDRPVSAYLRDVDAQHSAWIDFFRAWTDYGKSKWYLWPAALGIGVCALAVRQKSLKKKLRGKFRRAGEFFLFLFVCGAAAGIVTDVIKPILGRARPVELGEAGLYGFHPWTFAARWNSMPSGHATAAFAFAFVVVEFFPRLRIPVFILAIALAASRVMVNAHYVSDILAGVLVAWLTFRALQVFIKVNGIFHRVESIFPIDGPRNPR